MWLDGNMTCVRVAEIKSRIKGHHVYAYKYTVGELLNCVREIKNRYSQNAIVVNAVTEKGKGVKFNVIVGHIPEPLSEVLASFMDNFKIHSIITTIEGQHRLLEEHGYQVEGLKSHAHKESMEQQFIRKRKAIKNAENL